MSNLSDIATHTRAGNATMTDSDGLLKWAPHNLALHSGDLTNPVWATTNVSWTTGVTDAKGGTAAFTATADVLGSFMEIRQSITGIANTYETIKVRYRGLGISSVTFRLRDAASISNRVDLIVALDTGTVSSVTAFGTYTDASGTIEDLGSGWYEVAARVKLGSGTSVRLDTVVNSGSVVSTGDFSLYYPHAYRSDLGGMVNNPATGDSYVPTTDTARYLPRVGHHIWNGSAWVDEGYFHESEARTNLLLNSGTLSTQSVTVTAVPHTLHFTGTGTVTLSGASTSGPLVGTGTGENNRVILTFTPTAGTLIVTPSGDVSDAQLEVGSTPSSYIPTAGATVTRAADTLTVPSANLPWPTPNVIGPELVTNGTFDTDLTGWLTGSTATVTYQTGTQDVLVERNPATAFRILFQQELNLTAGKVYRITFDVNNQDSTGYGVACSATFDGTASVLLTTNTDLGSSSRVATFVAPANCNFVGFYGGGSAEFIIDNVSVREIDPLAVSIQMEGTMTYADKNLYNTVIPYQWVLATGTSIDVAISTNSTDSGGVYFRQSNLAVYDEVSVQNAYSPGINVPFNIASRHGSTFINGAVDGTALTANLTPTALPYLENTDMQIGSTFNGTIKLFRMWADDLTDEGTSEASA